MIDWLRSFRSGPRPRHVPVAEGIEPRLLFSADLAGGLTLGADVAEGAQVRVLDHAGEYLTEAVASGAGADMLAAVAPQYTMPQDGKLAIRVSELLEGSDGTLDLVGLVQGVGGEVSQPSPNANVLHFQADPGFSGIAHFDYVLGDGSTTTVFIEVTAGSNAAPVAEPDTLEAVEDTPATFPPERLLANDQDTDGHLLFIGSVGDAVGGTVVLNEDGSVTFTPDPDFHGAASFRYTATDGRASSEAVLVTVNVAPVNDAPTVNYEAILPAMEEDATITVTREQLLAHAADVDGDALTVTGLTASNGTVTANADGTWTFRPAANYHGSVTFTYGVSDGAATAPATASLVVTPVDDAPVGGADHFTTDAGRPLTIAPGALLANDSDVEGSPLSVSAVTAGTGGSVTLNADGSVTFRPDAGFGGTASFTYTVSDGTLAAVVPVSIEVVPPPEAPLPPVGTEPLPPAPVPEPPAPVPEPPAPVPPPAAESPPPAPPAVDAGPAIPPVTAAPAPPSDGAGTAPPRAPRPAVSLQDALGAAPESPIAALHASGMSFGASAAHLAFQAEGSRVTDSIVFDRSGLQLIAAQGTDLALAHFGIESRSGGAQLADFQRSIRSSAFAQELDRLREAVREELDFDKSVTISVVSVSLGLSFVYVLWLIRGGVLLGSYLSALPAWRILDPLPVLARSDEEGEEDDEPLDAQGPGSRNTLRGFG